MEDLIDYKILNKITKVRIQNYVLCQSILDEFQLFYLILNYYVEHASFVEASESTLIYGLINGSGLVWSWIPASTVSSLLWTSTTRIMIKAEDHQVILKHLFI